VSTSLCALKTRQLCAILCGCAVVLALLVEVLGVWEYFIINEENAKSLQLYNILLGRFHLRRTCSP